MTHTIFTVTPEQLAALDAARAVALVANLLWAEARRIGLPTTQVRISSRINVPDGGVDASVDSSGISNFSGSFLPEGRSAFQIKTGESFKPWQEAIIKTELFGEKSPSRDALGDSVRGCLDAGGVYVLVCTGTDPDEKEGRSAIENLQKFFGICGYQNAKVQVWGQFTLKGMLQTFPSLALDVNGNENVHFLTHAVWSSQAEMNRPFKAGARQQEFIHSLQATLRWSDRPVHVRVRGEAGIGKTRLVREASAVDDIRPLVLYCDGPAELLGGQLMAELLREDTQPHAILVVDECDLERRTLIWNRLQYHSPRIKLVSIYNDPDEPSGMTTVQDAPPLDEMQVIEIIQEYGAPKDEARRWADFCDGSPRVAHVIGQNLKNNPEDILRNPDTVNVWDRYVAGSDNLNSEEVQQRRVVLRHIALFKRFGYGTPVSEEAKAIARLVEKANPQITWPRFREIVKLLRERKILQGEITMYITPRLLHIWLWADWWDTYAEGFDLQQFSEGLPGQLSEWFLEMFQYAAQSKAALEITNDLLDEKGRFGDLSFFENRRGTRFLLALTNAAPEAALRYLQRTVGTWDVERLSKFVQGRREAVWSLERIAVWRTLFPGAARLLLKLAEAENEDFANNSTGVFADLFSPGRGPLAPTEASPEERFPILKEALDSPSKKQREIALKACDQALQTSDLSRMIGVEYQGLRRPPQLWMPRTWGELFDAYRRVWNLLLEKLDAFEPGEREKAIEILTAHARGLSRIANVSDMVIGTLSDLAAKFPGSRRKIIEAVEHIVHYESKNLAPDKFQQWEALRTELTDTDFHSQMERYVGMDLLEDGFDEQGNIVDRVGPKIMSLAQQAIENPALLDAELQWLVTEGARNGYRFGHDIATLDKEFILLERLLKAQQGGSASGSVFFLSGYFSVLFERRPELWEKTMDQLPKDQMLQGYVPELTWRSGMTERAADRILSMAEAGTIPLGSLRMFSFGGVVRRIPEAVFHKWVHCLLRAGTRIAAWTALDLFHFYYLMGETQRPLPRELALELLTARPFFEKAESRGFQTEEYDWGHVAKVFLNQYPEEGLKIANRLLGSFGEADTVADAYRGAATDVLTRIAKQTPAQTWKLIAEFLGPPVDSRAYHIAQWLREGGLRLMPSDKVWDWIEADVTTRAWYAATFVPPTLAHQEGETCWARELLVRYGDRKDVRSNLHANFSTDSWTGLVSNYYQGKKQWLESFRTHETDANVLRWIEDFIDSLNHNIDNARIREEREF